jgi:hypothetical protein
MFQNNQNSIDIGVNKTPKAITQTWKFQVSAQRALDIFGRPKASPNINNINQVWSIEKASI